MFRTGGGQSARRLAWTGLLLVLAAVGSSAADGPAVGFEVWMGLSRNEIPATPVGCWVPVHVVLHGLEDDFRGYFELRPGNSASPLISEPVEVGAGGAKHYQFCFPQRGDLWSVNVRLADSRRKTITASRHSMHPEPCRYFGVVGPFCGLDAMEDEGEGEPTAIRNFVFNIDPEDLPVLAQGYDSLTMLFLSQPQAGLLDGPRAEALRAWVADGGILLVAGGPTAQLWRGSVVEELLPVSEVSTAQVTDLVELGERFALSLPQQAALIVNPAKPKPSSRVVATTDVEAEADDRLPLLTSRPYGNGHVIFMAFSASHLVAMAGPGAKPELFWRRVLPHYLFGYPHTWRQYGSNVNALGKYLVPKKARPLPIGFVVFFFLAYFACVVPLDYALRKRLPSVWKRLGLALLLIGFFSVLVVALTLLFKGTMLVCREFAVVDARAVDATVSSTGYVGVFSPRASRYEITYDAPCVMISPVEESETDFRAGGELSAFEYRALAYDFQLFSVRACAPQRAIKGATELENLELILEKLGGRLYDVFVIQGKTIYAVGQIQGPPLRTPLVGPDMRGQSLYRWRDSNRKKADHLLSTYIDRLVSGVSQHSFQQAKNPLDNLPPVVYANTLVTFDEDTVNAPSFLPIIALPEAELRDDCALVVGTCAVSPFRIKMNGAYRGTERRAVARIIVSKEVALGEEE